MDEEPVLDIYHATSSPIPSTSLIPIKSQTMVKGISTSPENLRRSTASATIRRLPPPTDSLERCPPKASPKMTTFALPPVTEASNLGHPFSTSPPPYNTSSHPIQRSNSIFGKLSRKLSQSKTANGRGSLSSKNSAAAAAAGASMVESNHSERIAPQDQSAGLSSSLTETSQAGQGLEVPSGQTTLERKGSGLKRGLRALGRSKSEGRRGDGWKSPARIRAEGREKVEQAGVETKSIEQSSTGELFWEERLGICWDGREQVHPDFTYNPNPAVQPYSSNADFLPNSAHRHSYYHHTDSGGVAPPSRVVYASTLSTFPPRPPLKSKLTTSPPPSPVIQMTPASQVIADYFAACRDREESERKTIGGSVYRYSTPPLTTSASASQSLTPIPSTPQLLQQMSLDVMSPITTTTTTTTAAATTNTTVAASVSMASIYSDATSKSSVSRSAPPSEEEMGRRRRFGRNSEESDTSLESMRERESSSEQDRQTKEGVEKAIVEGDARNLLPAVLSLSSNAGPAFPLRQTLVPLSATVPSTSASAVAIIPPLVVAPNAFPPLVPIDIPIKSTTRSPASSDRQGHFFRHERTPSSGSNFSAFGHPGGATGVYASRTPPPRSPPLTPSTPPATTTTTTTMSKRSSPVIRSRGKLSSSPFTTTTTTTTMTTKATATARFALVDEGSAANNSAMSSSSLSSPSPGSSQGPLVSDGGTANLATSPVSPGTSNITLQPTPATPPTSSVPILKALPSAVEALSISTSPPVPPQAATTSINVPQWRTTLTTFTIPPVQADTTNLTKTTETEIDNTATPIINTTIKPLRTPVKDFIDREYLHDERDEEDDCSSVETGDWRDCFE